MWLEYVRSITLGFLCLIVWSTTARAEPCPYPDDALLRDAARLSGYQTIVTAAGVAH